MRYAVFVPIAVAVFGGITFGLTIGFGLYPPLP
jgi:hypothetical protein